MAGGLDRVVDRGVVGEETLSRALRLEASHLALSNPDRKMRILRAIVLSQPARFLGSPLSRWPHLAANGARLALDRQHRHAVCLGAGGSAVAPVPKGACLMARFR